MTTIPQAQTNNLTFLGRHWVEHKLISRYLKSDRDLSILSFGCSTGEELVSLRLLFPNADLFGCDVDWQNIQLSRALLKRDATIFYSDFEQISRFGPFDVIICNSVLLAPTTVGADGRRRGLSADLWLSLVSTLDQNLKSGGLLQIINSAIPFRFYPGAAKYTPLRSALILGNNFVDQFDLEGRHLCSGIGGVGWSAIIPRHAAEPEWQLLLPSDLTDTHFFKSGEGIRTPDAIDDEIVLNLMQSGQWARGSSSYETVVADGDPRPSTRTTVNCHWTAVAPDAVRVVREVDRYWFDGSLISKTSSTLDLVGPAGTSAIEAATGRRSTHMNLTALMNSAPIRAPQFG